MSVVMIGVTGSNLLNTIKLFYEDQAHELVGEYERGERPNKVRSLVYAIINTVSAPNNQRHPTTGREGCVQEVGRLWRINLITSLIEQYYILASVQPRKYTLRLFLTRRSVLQGTVW